MNHATTALCHAIRQFYAHPRDSKVRTLLDAALVIHGADDDQRVFVINSLIALEVHNMGTDDDWENIPDGFSDPTVIQQKLDDVLFQLNTGLSFNTIIFMMGE